MMYVISVSASLATDGRVVGSYRALQTTQGFAAETGTLRALGRIE